MGSLEWLHFVHQRSMPISGKKVYFEVETDWWYVILEVLDRETMREFRIMNRALDSVVEMFESAESAKSERNFEVQKLQRVFDRSKQLVDLLTAQLIDRLVSVLKRVRATDAD